MRDKIAWALASAIFWLIATPKYYRWVRCISKLGVAEFDRRFQEEQP